MKGVIELKKFIIITTVFSMVFLSVFLFYEGGNSEKIASTISEYLAPRILY